MGYGGSAVSNHFLFTLDSAQLFFGLQLLQHKAEIMSLLSLLVDKTLSERGYTGTGRLITRILNTITGIHPINTRFVNTDEWEDPSAITFLICRMLLISFGSV